MNEEILVRPAIIEDAEIIVEFVKKLGTFEKFHEKDMPVTTEMIKHNIFEKEFCKVFIAETNKIPVGICTFFFTFSAITWKPAIQIEDLFVISEFRRKKVGLKLLKELARFALDNCCEKIEWSCLSWNDSALKFYQSIGSKIIEPKEEYSIENSENIAKLFSI